MSIASLNQPSGYLNASYYPSQPRLNLYDMPIGGYQEQITICTEKINSLEKTVADLVDANNKLVQSVNMLMYHPLFGDKLIGSRADFYLQESLRRRSR